jgi:hypothetical protein
VIRCPRCSSFEVRPSKKKSFSSSLAEVIGFYRVKCEACSKRWVAYLGFLYEPFCAKCPRCYRTELTTWDPKMFIPNRWQRLKIALGARRARCERCRMNFSSFRAFKRKRQPGKTVVVERMNASPEVTRQMPVASDQLAPTVSVASTE